jgi:oxidoreductase
MTSYTAVVAGSTGACGRDVVAALLNSQRCTKVTALVRPGGSVDKRAKTVTGVAIDTKSPKLHIAEIDWEKLRTEGPAGAQAAVVKGHDYAINCLGTTKKDAGGSAGFLRVDRDYYTGFARACHAQAVTSYTQVSSAGASAGSPFLYVKCKGECDDLAMGLGFAKCWVLRPGLLERGDATRFVERVGKWFMSGFSLSCLANAAVHAYERQMGGATNILGEKEMKGEYA